MIDITGLREDKRPQSSTIVHALLDRLEAAEKERDTLRAKIEQMERQEPAGWLDESDLRELGYGNSVWLNPDDQGRMVPVYLAAAPEAKP